MSTRASRTRVAVILLASLLPIPAQQNATQPYFSLSSSKTFAPGDKPTIQMWAQNVDSLEFRVYRVKDPILFFQKLEDVHRFGAAAAPRKNKQLTLIERFHSIKLRARNRVRNSFREQYTADSREAIRNWLAARNRQPATAPVTAYPGIPLLNQQQVVTVWKQNVTRGQRWESEAIPIPVTDKGLYLVEAANESLRAYTVVIVTDLAIVTKTGPGRVVSFVTDRASRAPVANCPLLVWSGKKELARIRTDASGLADVKISEADPESTLVLARRGDDFAIDAFGNWNLSSDPDRYTTGYIYTDRPVYRPGHTVHWKAILRSQGGSVYRVPAARQVTVEILDPEGKPASRKEIPVSAMGTAQGDLPLPVDSALGYYSIQVHVGEGETSGGFHVEEYKKPEYEVRVTPTQRRVLQGAPMQAQISARYFFGEPVARASVKYVVHKFRYWYPLYADEDDGGDEEREEGYYGQGEQIAEESGQLDADGKLSVSIPTEVSEQKWDMRYRIEARVTDAASREIAGAVSVLATHGSFLVNIQPDQYVYEPGQRVTFTVEARNYDGGMVQTAVRADLFEHVWRKPEGTAVQQADARTDAAGRAKISFVVGKGGSYMARVSARTPGAQAELDRWFEHRNEAGARPPSFDSVPLDDVVPAWDRVISVHDAQAFARLSALFAQAGKSVQLRGGRSVSLTDLRGRPLVLIGAFSNDWTLSLAGELRFYFDVDRESGSIVRDRKNPKMLDWKIQKAWPQQNIPIDYAVVSRVVNPVTEQTLVIAAGITHFGTQAAGEFLTNPRYFAEALRDAPRDWPRKNMQVVLSTQVMSGNAGPPKVLAVDVW